MNYWFILYFNLYILWIGKMWIHKNYVFLEIQQIEKGHIVDTFI